MQSQISLNQPGTLRHNRAITSTSRGFKSAWADVIEGVKLWPLWGTLGWNEILQRYRRSTLGPFWLTASMAVMVIALGVVYAELFRQRIEDFIPFFCVGIVGLDLNRQLSDRKWDAVHRLRILHQANQPALLSLRISVWVG